MNLEELEIFNLPKTVDAIQSTPIKGNLDPNLYSIKLDDVTEKDGIYRSKIRFIPYHKNIGKCIISKYTYWLTDVSGDNGILVDDPASIGEKSPIQSLYWKLKNSNNAADNMLSEKLKRSTNYYSLVQIVEDKQHPEFVGKIMVFKYGVKIKEKIDSEYTDEDGGNPFDLFNGRIFRLEVKKSGGFQNYDSCRFVGVQTPIEINGTKMKSTATDKKKIVDYITDVPNLCDYEYKQWSAELEEQVFQRLSTYKGMNSSVLIEKGIKQDVSNEPEEINDDDDLFDGIDL